MTPEEKTEAMLSNNFEIIEHPLKHILLELEQFDNAEFLEFEDGSVDYFLYTDYILECALEDRA